MKYCIFWAIIYLPLKVSMAVALPTAVQELSAPYTDADLAVLRPALHSGLKIVQSFNCGHEDPPARNGTTQGIHRKGWG
jgi:hypothetical protein